MKKSSLVVFCPFTPDPLLMPVVEIIPSRITNALIGIYDVNFWFARFFKNISGLKNDEISIHFNLHFIVHFYAKYLWL